MSGVTLDVLDALEYEVLWNFIDFFTVNTQIENGIDHLKLTERGLDSIWDDFGYWRRFGEADRNAILQLMEEPFEISKNDKIYNSHDFLELANNVNALKQNLDELTKTEIERKFKQILNKLVDMEMKAVTGDIYYRLKGLRGVRERYNDYLYPKQQKIFEFMLEKATNQGRWKNLNQAVESVLPELDSVLKDFDKAWINQKLEEKTQALKQAVQQFEEYKKNPPERKFYEPKTRDKTIEDWIRGLRMQCETFKKASLADDPSSILGNKLAYNTLYQPESIKNLLKKHPEIVEQIVVKNKKS
ncbi:hypothetical protein F900_02741 [Acinetobacter modestus]|uniref:Uncharacterized protein n=1 Tax=Acinetobacter modestus TaxID=1776740 RepID=N9LR23_9GAMM|nr:hypothetical protein [Acinetobacter modestus]ENW98658.1 hypothetical protein F900_02741 [Acinetobacter modestus]